MKRMTMRERMLAVVQGREHERVPFVQYDGIGAPTEDIWAEIGREHMGVLRWLPVHQVAYPHCRYESHEFERNGRRALRSTLHTPAGDLTQEQVFEPAYGSANVREHYVKEPADYHALMAFLGDAVYRDNFDEIRRHDAELGESGLCHVSVDRTPYQQLWIQWVSLQDLGLHLVDHPDLMHEVMSLLAGNLRKVFAMAREAPAPYVVVPDNITAPPIGGRYFREWCVPLYDELADMLADRGLLVYVHMDGDLKPLWQAIGESKVRGLDSLSPPPDNDTSVAQAAGMWPEMRLAVNFPSSVHLAEPEVVHDRAQQILAEGGPQGRLQIQISENVPAGRWRVSFPQIVRAIEEFGEPGR